MLPPEPEDDPAADGDPDPKALMARLGALDALIAVLAAHASNAVIVMAAAGALTQLTIRDENKARFVATGGVEVAVQALVASRGDAAVLPMDGKSCAMVSRYLFCIFA